MSSFKPSRFSTARLTGDAVTPKSIYLRRREF
ncbi:oxidoreductase molybdopterin binding subunit, partial [Brucella melitensis bv. 1 str. Rev.1]